ncbi:MAG: formate--tetrahydrofolate ligase, partial [Bacteroidaceae bacterium]|nr:formate--tetrahydrofolate ligase [Bacteroidaceae bacterium]
MKTDLEIAHSTTLKNIDEVAATMQIPTDELEHYCKYIAKLPLHLMKEQKGKLILVTAITATRAGIGKTTVSIG